MSKRAHVFHPLRSDGGDKTLKREVQGHTDNVGDDAYNQTLSQARAKTVMTWTQIYHLS